jgi:hypothetical protein
VESSTYSTGSSAAAGVVGLDEEPTYRSISVMALVSLLLGITAPLCIMAPLLFALPIAGVALALLALRNIATSDGALIGRTAALIGLALSVASVCMTVTRAKVSEEMFSRQARAAAIEWITLLQAGKTDEAFEMSTAKRKGPPPPSPVNIESPQPVRKPIDEFRETPVVHFLVQHAKDADVRYVGDAGFDPGIRGAAMIGQEYDVAASQEPGGQSPTRIQLGLERVRGAAGTPWQWLVANYQSDVLKPHVDEGAGEEAHAHPHSH